MKERKRGKGGRKEEILNKEAKQKKQKNRKIKRKKKKIERKGSEN